ncbi:MAG TPA: sigma-70 family RNA polymerase sigma factor [Polyangiaceae bacterium]|jgi:RNA polymerase sigma-70 factor (ECF subfamily)
MGSSVVCLPEGVLPVESPSRPRFETVYADHFAFVWRMARRLGVPDASLDDVVQDVFLVFHRRLEEYDGRATVRSWLLGILSHVARDHRRRYRRKGAACVAGAPDSSSKIAAVSADPGPAALAERQEQVALLKRLLDQLDDDKKTILVLAYLEQLRVPEIAEMLGLNLNTAYARLRAAKRAFDELYEVEQSRPGKGSP